MPEVRQTQQFRTWLRRLKDSNVSSLASGEWSKGILEIPGVSARASWNCVSIMDLDIASTTSIVEPRSSSCYAVETSVCSSRISGALMIWSVTWRKGNDLDHAL